MRRWGLWIVFLAATGYAAGDLHPTLTIAISGDHGTLVPFATAVDSSWSSPAGQGSPIWTMEDAEGKRLTAQVKASHAGACGMVLETDPPSGSTQRLAFGVPMSASHFVPVWESRPMMRDLNAAVQGKGDGAWTFQVAQPMPAGWRVYGYSETSKIAPSTKPLIGLIAGKGDEPLRVIPIDHGGQMVGLFEWLNQLYLVETNQADGVATTRLWAIRQTAKEMFKRECGPA